MRRLLKAESAGRPLGDTPSLENPGVPGEVTSLQQLPHPSCCAMIKKRACLQRLIPGAGELPDLVRKAAHPGS